MIKVINEEQITDVDEIEFLYHWVESERVKDYVLNNGLTADDDYCVYLMSNPVPFNKGGFMFRVTIPDTNRLHDWREYWHDDDGVEFDDEHIYDPDNPYFIYEGNIDKKYVNLV